MIHHQNHPFLSHVEQRQQLKHPQLPQQPQPQLQSQQQLSSSTSPSSNDSSLSEANSNNLNSRVSPASTALVMSSNNINGQSISRQLTPNTSSSNQGGTNSSSGTGRSYSPTQQQQQHHQQQQQQSLPPNNATGGNNHNIKTTAPKSNRPQQAPNPMVRQSFANCHAKSMSAGVVVSVPGISTNLGGHRNIIKLNSHHPPNPHRPLPLDPDTCQQKQEQRQQQQQLQQKLHADPNPINPAAMQDNQHVQQASTQLNYHSRSGSANNNNNHLVQQQVIREHQTLDRNHQAHGHNYQNHHHRQQSQPNTLNHQLIAQQQNSHNQQQLQQQQQQNQIFNPRNINHHNQQLQQNHHNNQQQQATSFNVSNEQQHFQQINQASNSTIMLSNRNINQLHHNRSASAQLAHHHHESQQVIMNNHHLSHGSNNNNDNNNLNVPSNYPCHITANANSIWSIDENISKSQGKLTSSGFLNNPSCLFNNSITDVSCDNLSNASRLLDPTGASCPPPPPNPASAYYLHHHSRNVANNLPNNNAISTNSGLSIKRPEFLPFCDLMFNFISMIIYFCENTFGIIALIALYYHTHYSYFALVGTAFVFASNITCQYLSFKWLYNNKLDECYRKREAQEELEGEEGCERRYYGPAGMNPNLPSYQYEACTWLPYDGTKVQIRFLLSIILDALLHLLCLGFLLRYIKLVIPITDTARVKRDGRDLCMLRMTHAFVQSIPLLLLKSYLICSQGSTVTNLSLTSAILSLINVCWALASFTKYARKKYSHKFVLTWLGIVSQFMWRLGTISSRVVALTIYAVYFGYWVLMIMLLHWIVMFVWLIQPGNLFKDEPHLTKPTRTFYAAIVGWIYCFCYVNFEELNPKIKVIVYYAIMFLENNLLLTLSLIFSTNTGWFKNISILIVYLGFVIGITFMLLYYKHLHATVLNSGLSCSRDSVDSIADQLTSAGKKIAGFKPGTLRLKSDDNFPNGQRFDNNIGATLHTGSHPEITRTIKPPYLASNQMEHTQSGVFNPKPAQLWERKQKLPSSHQRPQ